MVSKKDLVKGEIYYIHVKLAEFYNPIYIQKWKGPDIRIKDKKFHKNWVSYDVDIKFLELRKATSEEKQWLEECIKRDTFVPFDQIKIEKIHELW